MAEHVSIPAGVNPAAAGGNGPDVTHYGSRANSATPGAPGGDGGIPAVVPAAQQRPGFTQEQTPATGGLTAAEIASFRAWQVAQAAAPGTPAAAATTPAEKAGIPGVAINALGGNGMGAEAVMDAVKNAAAHDPVISTTFEMFGLVAPDLNLSRAVGNAIDRGDPSLIDRAYLREAGGDKAERLIKMAEGMVEHVNDKIEGVVTGIYTAAGGEAKWEAATAAFNTTAPAYLKAYVKDALNSADPTKIKSGSQAVLDFVKSAGSLPTDPTGHIRAGGGSPDAALGLSKQGYQEARLKLNKFDRGYNDAARELDARRQIGKKLGL